MDGSRLDFDLTVTPLNKVLEGLNWTNTEITCEEGPRLGATLCSGWTGGRILAVGRADLQSR